MIEPTSSDSTNGTKAPLLAVEDLFVEFDTRDGVSKVLNGVSYHVNAGETLAVLGESGSGKSVTAQAVMGILDIPPARIRSGAIRYDGRDLLTLTEDERRDIRGRDIAMVFQDALSALNPVFPVGWQIGETLRVRKGLSAADAEKRAIELMDLVRIPAARARVREYPHQFSGGMRQRVMIALALALGPKVLIADEPTTALDVTVQAQIMDLLAELRVTNHMALILITHDLGVVAGVADRVAVMYAGRIVEYGNVEDIYAAPANPYTRALLDSIPERQERGRDLRTIKGLPPSLTRIPTGCPFHPRCPLVQDVCRTTVPAYDSVKPTQASACHFAEEVVSGRL